MRRSCARRAHANPVLRCPFKRRKRSFGEGLTGAIPEDRLRWWEDKGPE